MGPGWGTDADKFTLSQVCKCIPSFSFDKDLGTIKFVFYKPLVGLLFVFCFPHSFALNYVLLYPLACMVLMTEKSTVKPENYRQSGGISKCVEFCRWVPFVLLIKLLSPFVGGKYVR